jgi:TonB family protein
MSILATIVFTSLLLGQGADDGVAPQMDFPPNQHVLADILSAPSARVCPNVRQGNSDEAGPVFTVGGGVKPPRIIYQPQPDFPEKARKHQHTGTVTIRAIVGIDGKVHNARVVRRAGWGLDEQALAAVNQWLFETPTKDGCKVAVYLDVEVNFALF